MFLSTVVLCLLFTGSTIALPKEDENATSSDSQNASVKEVSQPPMTVQNAAPQEYIPPSYYTFNKGEPFYVEKDPLTGAIDFNRKTTPKNTDAVESHTSSALKDEKTSPAEAESDYFYDDQEFPEDAIDRKDGNIEGPNTYRPNDIFQNPYKISPDLHQFLNLPVHYSSSDKFPLISSSYANTKVQGTGSSSSYSNHKYVTTSSTQSPSYYTMPTTKYTTLKPIYHSTFTTKTSPTTTTTKPISSTTEIEEEYENTDYNEYEEESGPAQDNQALPSEHNTYRPETIKYTVTTYRPTTFRFTTTTTTQKPRVETTTTEKPKQQVSIVTSLPLDVYYSTSEESTTASVATAVTSTQNPTTTKFINGSNLNQTVNLKTEHSGEHNKFSNNPTYNIPTEGLYSGFGEEPFRPIFGPPLTPTENEGDNQIIKSSFPKHKPEEVNEFQRLPPHQNIPYIQRPATPSLPPQMEPPRPDAPQSFFPDQPVKLGPLQQPSNNFGETASINSINRPSQSNLYERPPPLPFHNNEPNSHSDFGQHGASQNSPNNHPVYEGRPSERPIQSVKPRPPAELPPKSNFKVPSKIENHFIKVSPDQENPSYSLQTSFSIGVPASGSKEQFQVQQGQGVGQVFFPDNTPAETNPVETNPNLPAQVLRPPNNRVPVQGYQPNRPGHRPPIQIQPRPPLHRLPNDDLQPPNGEPDFYPRPHWENHNKPLYSPIQNTIPKKDIVLPQNYPGLSRGKPENIQRPDLPNILPQFRPNAKVGHVDYRQPTNPLGERLREPLDTLQPPPLPKPQHLRINRNDEESEIDREISSGEMRAEPLVHRRSGPQLPRVTTLQMMQQNPHKKTGIRLDTSIENRQSSDKEKPVFLVYPSSHGIAHKPQPEEVVVIGTRAQRPLPPANLEKDDLDSFPLDDNKNFPIPSRDRVDTPILKTKVPSKPLIKNEFPYPIMKPFANDITEERILATGSNIKEYTAFSPTPASSTEEIKDHDSEINVIPYLQDYMPFATKKPQIIIKPPTFVKKDPKLPQKPLQTNHVISTTLNNSLATTTAKTTTEKSIEKQAEIQEKNGSEMTVSATIYTQQRPANHKVPVTYTPSEPQPLGFQAPFMASLSAPESQGWTVVTDKILKPGGDVQEESKNTDIDESKFDIENFKPQLFGGFKPIMPSSEDESVAGATDKDKDILLNKGDREERAL